MKTAEAVHAFRQPEITPLKRGVNERATPQSRVTYEISGLAVARFRGAREGFVPAKGGRITNPPNFPGASNSGSQLPERWSTTFLITFAISLLAGAVAAHLPTRRLLRKSPDEILRLVS